MRRVSSDNSNNWDEHPELQRQVKWRTASGVVHYIMFEATVGAQRWSVRINDFPDEPLYSLLIDGDEVIHFDDWPRFWGTTPPPPERRD